MVTGKVATNSASFAQRVFSQAFPASSEVSTRAIVERMPLHSSAISIDSEGKSKTNPCRWNGVRVTVKKNATQPADPLFSHAVAVLSATGGSGIMNTRKSSGNIAARNAVVP